MKISRGALVFGGIVITIIVVIAGMAWFSSLFKAPTEGEKSPVQNLFSSLFPFGTNVRENPQGGGSQTPENQGEVPRLRKVSDAPVAGFRFQKSGVVRFVERETGHLFETAIDSWEVTRLSNTTIPGIETAVWLSDTDFVLEYRDGQDATKRFLAAIASSTPDQSLSGRFLPTVSELIPDDGKKPLTVTRTTSNVRVERMSIETGVKADALFTSPVRSWRVLSAGGRIFLETAPTSSEGFLYELKGGSLVRIASGEALTALPNGDGTAIAYSTGGASAGLFILDLSKNQTYRAPVTTFAEKCAWFPGKALLLFCGVPGTRVSIEEWYMGLATTNDTLWIIDPVSGTATVTGTPEADAGQQLDTYRPATNGTGSAVGFLDKKTLTFWLLKL